MLGVAMGFGCLSSIEHAFEWEEGWLEVLMLEGGVAYSGLESGVVSHRADGTMT